MPLAIVDIGTNSTRLLIAEVENGVPRELLRRSEVTRLGDGVDAGGSLSAAAMDRVFARLAEYAQEIKNHGCTANMAVLTSAVRDAANGREFTERVRTSYGLDARILSGDEEAQLTFLGAMSGRTDTSEPAVVIDIGGGSTEFVIGTDGAARFHTSLHAGVVRMSERHIKSDPPAAEELQALADDTRATFHSGLPAEQRTQAKKAIAVAGTATSAAAIEQELSPYDPARVHGYELQLGSVEMMLARLAEMDEEERRRVIGLHPDRAPTIVAGMILLSEAIKAFSLEQAEVSEHDILFGGILQLAQGR